MRRSLRQLKLQRKIPDTDSPGILPELLQDGRDPLNGLDQVAWFRAVGHRFLMRNRHYDHSALDIFVKHFLCIFYRGVLWLTVKVLDRVSDPARSAGKGGSLDRKRVRVDFLIHFFYV